MGVAGSGVGGNGVGGSDVDDSGGGGSGGGGGGGCASSSCGLGGDARGVREAFDAVNLLLSARTGCGGSAGATNGLPPVDATLADGIAANQAGESPTTLASLTPSHDMTPNLKTYSPSLLLLLA